MAELFIGVEIGGTKQQIAVCDEAGQIVRMESERVVLVSGAPDICAWIEKTIDKLLEEFPTVRAIGVGFGGPLESATGRCIMSLQVPGWENFELKTWLEEKYPLPVTVVNDTVAGGYALATGGDGDAVRMGKSATATDAFPVTLGSSGRLLAAAVGAGIIPDTRLNNGEFYTAATDETSSVSGRRFLETKEYYTVSYSCAYDGCENTYTDYADGSRLYTVKTPESLGFQNHGLTFAGFVDLNGNMVDSLTVSGPIALKAGWKVVFTFDAGEGGADSVPPIDVINSGNTVRLPECGIAPPAGYRFAGWKIDGDENIYAVGDEIPAAGEIHLTAVWEPVPVLPDTGDPGIPMLWAFLCFISCAMLWLLRAKARN